MSLPRLSRHRRFFGAFVAGLAAGALTFAAGWPLSAGERGLVAANAFFLSYLVLMAALVARMDHHDLRRHVEDADEGIWLIALLALAAVAGSGAAILGALAGPSGGSAVLPALALASVPLGWATLHMVMAFHYATLWYARPGPGDPARGLTFPGTPSPGLWEFLYHSYVIGMTAQVADVDVTSSRMRRAVMAHSVTAFFYNTAILALAVNAAVSLGR